MKSVFYLGLAGLTLFEIMRVYLIMPMPGSQGIESLDVAYFLHAYRWFFRGAFALLILAGCSQAIRIRRKWLPAAAVLLVGGIGWWFNFQMTAERMFEPPHSVSFKPRAENAVDENSLVIAVEHNGEAKAYPIRFLVYHHQVPDTVGGKPVLVTYCSVCRSGRVFDPIVQGKPATFRLVGMDHFNAMFEDASTRSWWRQATGEAVAGPLRGHRLAEVSCAQLTARAWFELHPDALVMQPDDAAKTNYSEGKFERGENKSKLTGTDHESWKDKSWVVGVQIGGVSKAYDWNRLKERRIINDQIGDTPIVLVLAPDQQSFAAFVRPAATETFTVDVDVLSSAGKTYDLLGRDRANSAQLLARVPAYQEFWHSWRTFQPDTQQDR